MIRISATLELNGAVVHDVTMPLREGGVWLGDHPDAVVVFPGGLLHVAPYLADHTGQPSVSVAGGASPVLLRPGGDLRIELDEGAALNIAVVREQRLAREAFPAGDVRLLVLTAAMVLFGVWWETANRWADRNPAVVAEVAAVMLGAEAVEPAQNEPSAGAPIRLLEPVRYRE